MFTNKLRNQSCWNFLLKKTFDLGLGLNGLNLQLRQCQRSSRLIRSFCSHNVELTSVRYKDDVKRGDFSTLEDKDLTFFETILKRSQIIPDAEDIAGHNVDWLKIVRGASKLLLKPKKAEEISAILRYCNERKLAVCPQGGNTGLVGGSVPVFDEIVLSTSLMNQIISFDELSGVLVCEAGCILEKMNDYLLDHGFMMPLDLGAKGSCQIGGNISTNAGGLKLIRYGSLHSTVLGLEAVMANGTIMDCLSTMKKDNTGYDLKHLFIGSEGTLGVVTKIAIQCPPKPNAISLAFLGMDSFENVLEVFKRSKRDLCEILSSCEYIDKDAMDCVLNNLKLKNPIKENKFYMVVESSGSNSTHDEEKMTRFLESLINDGIIDDGTTASEPSRILNLWAYRERIAEALMYDGYVYKYDLSIPLQLFDNLVNDMKKNLGSKVKRVCGYGHVGDGNIHLNITAKNYDSEITKLIEPFVYEWVARYRGSVSSEHGIGFKKVNFLPHSKSPESIQLMNQVKRIFDPKGILNPYKVLSLKSI